MRARTPFAIPLVPLFATCATCAVLATLAACASGDEKEVLPPESVAMLDTTPPAFDDGQDQLYVVEKEVRLPFRRPEDGERPSGKLDPYPRMPFHVVSDSRTTVRYTISNLDDKPHVVDLLIDPWNEFVRYEPGVVVSDEEMVPNYSGIQKSFVLPPLARLEGIFTPDDMQELAIDLATAMTLAQRPPDAKGQFAGPALYNRAFNIQNRSTEPDPVLRSWIPSGTVATVIGFNLGLRSSTPAKVAVEILVDVEDLNGDRVVMEGDDGKTLGPPGTVPLSARRAPRKLITTDTR